MHDSRATVRRFLGPQAVDFGPFGLLGVDPVICTAALVEAALQRQLDRVGAHAEGDTPEADEVRLALHAAAAQLLDPRVREHLADRWRDAYAQGAHTDDAAAEVGVDERRVLPPAGDARGIDHIPHRRGDNFAGLAVAGAVIVVALIGLVIGALVVLSPRGGAAPAGVAAPAPAPTGAAAAPPAESFASAADGVATIDPAPGGSTIGVLQPRAARSAFLDPRRTLKDLRDAATLARTDAFAAAKALEPALRQLGDWWPRYEGGVRRACDDAIVEALYAVSREPEAFDQVLAMLADGARSLGELPTDDPKRPRLGPDQVWPTAWSVGVLARLTRERDLPTRAASEIGRALDSALGAARSSIEPTFEAGAGGTLRRLPVLLLVDRRARSAPRDASGGPTGSTAAFTRWIEACAALAADEAQVERLLCDGLEQVLVNAKDPEEDLGAFDAIGAITQRITWRRGGSARARLLDWFRDSRISESDLRVLTSVLAARSSAEGVDSTMVLSINPRADDRSRLRAAYAKAWGIESAGRERASQRWLDACRGMLAAAPPADPVELLRETAMLARLTEASRLLWRGEADRAETLLRESAAVESFGTLALPHGQAAPAIHRLSMTGPGADATWTEHYLAAERSIPARLERLSQLERIGRPIGAVDASMLVQEAFIGSPIQVRYAAAKLAGLWADEVAIVAAVLDELPLAPRTPHAADLVERIARQPLPKYNDPDWPLAARRAVVERLLNMLAGGMAEASMEHFAALIAESYLRAAGQEAGRGPGAAAEGAARGSELLWRAIRAEADAMGPVEGAPISLDQIDRRRLGRKSLANGPVQWFAAEQVSIAEALAFVTAGERPTASRQVGKVIERMQAARRSAAHVFEQLYATERAILELWLLRFELGAQEGAT